MPLSRPACIPAVINFVWNNNIQSILDLGIGFGGYGALFRQTMDVRWGRVTKESWQATLDGVEISEEYNNPLWEMYNTIHVGDIAMELPAMEKHYQLIFFGDVLEHFPKEIGLKLIERAKDLASFIIVTTPNTFAGNEAEAERFHNDHEAHQALIEETDLPGFTRELFDNQQMFLWTK